MRDIHTTLQRVGSAEMSWYREWFDEEYVKVYGHRDIAEARRDVAFAETVLQLQPDDTILDLCCGMGRHLAVFCERGYSRLIGLDLSISLLRIARDTLGRSHCLARLLLGDMRHLPFRGCFDVVLNLFTSFGYFATEEEDQQVLDSIRMVLRPGGRFILDYLNPEHALRNLSSRTERRIEGRRVIELRSVDDHRQRLNKSIEIHTPEGIKHYEESIRLYSLDEMYRLLENAGLEVKALYGDFDFRPMGMDQPRMIFIGKTFGS